MDLKKSLQEDIQEGIKRIYAWDRSRIELQKTKSDFSGDYTLVLFPLVKILKKNLEEIALSLGEYLVSNSEFVSGYSHIKGFLNLSIKDHFLLENVRFVAQQLDEVQKKNETIMVEYSSPNTNKPLHLGHIRNNLLGYSLANILEENGYKVIKTQIINDRGVHICKSMWAWEKFGEGKTPESTQTKGDKLVGDFYVMFDKKYKEEIKELKEQGIPEERARKEAPSILEVQKMLLGWENGDEKVRALWEKMNRWVYLGFDVTYKRLGVNFDQVQYESTTYILGKDIIEEGIKKGVFYKKSDGSVWVDLSEEGLDEKLLLRSDGTSVYITQDLGTAVERFKRNSIDRLIYTVGNEQDYHFQVLFGVLKKLGYSWAGQLYHLSYGMVELPEGKMKSREGNVVDADDLMQQMYNIAKEKARELGKLDTLSPEEKRKSYETVGLGALKYFMLKVEPRKKMLFDPEESIDFNGNTGPFIQYAYARIQSLISKVDFSYDDFPQSIKLNPYERDLIYLLSIYKETLTKAADSLNPAHMANYVYDLVKSYNAFYQNNPILSVEDISRKKMRLYLSNLTAKTIKKSLALLGIQTVDRM
ncbi:MAG: arginine--tRNA ligase [Bergeyella sp.]|nr:arginine--tRNA ligase [Bergeyella sp.]